jgi:RNA polymerase sigma-70 factor (ECF subfamily)
MSRLRVTLAAISQNGSTADDDLVLVANLAAGDADSLGRLYDRYSGALRALGIKLLGDHRDAEEILHEVFLEVWRHAHDYNPARGTVRSWLVLRMRSRALDRRRTPHFSRHVPIDVDHLREASLGQPDDVLFSGDHATVRRAVAELSAEQQQLLELTYFQGLTVAEAAAQVGIPLGTAKSRLATGIANLRAQLLPKGRQ